MSGRIPPPPYTTRPPSDLKVGRLRRVLERIRMHLDERAVRQQLALAMNRASARRVPLAGRDLELVAALERIHRLHESLAERRRSDDERAVVVLQRAGDDLRGRRRAAVEQHDERNVEREMAAGRLAALRSADCATGRSRSPALRAGRGSTSRAPARRCRRRCRACRARCPRAPCLTS